MNIGEAQKYYKGFFIEEPVGNNAFSFSERKNRRIWVPPLIEGEVEDIAKGELPVFGEVEEGRESAPVGLREFVYIRRGQKDIFVFDNHNHAYFFWKYAHKYGNLSGEEYLLHVDQHTDMREPESYPEITFEDEKYTEKIFNYTNYILNVGNFIKPALREGVFRDVVIVDSSFAFDEEYGARFVLDLDLDIFSQDMAYIPEERKIEKINGYLEQASLITVAVSPFFIDTEKALAVLRELLANVT